MELSITDLVIDLMTEEGYGPQVIVAVLMNYYFFLSLLLSFCIDAILFKTFKVSIFAILDGLLVIDESDTLVESYHKFFDSATSGDYHIERRSKRSVSSKTQHLRRSSDNDH